MGNQRVASNARTFRGLNLLYGYRIREHARRRRKNSGGANLKMMDGRLVDDRAAYEHMWTRLESPAEKRRWHLLRKKFKMVGSVLISSRAYDAIHTQLIGRVEAGQAQSRVELLIRMYLFWRAEDVEQCLVLLTLNHSDSVPDMLECNAGDGKSGAGSQKAGPDLSPRAAEAFVELNKVPNFATRSFQKKDLAIAMRICPSRTLKEYLPMYESAGLLSRHGHGRAYFRVAAPGRAFIAQRARTENT